MSPTNRKHLFLFHDFFYRLRELIRHIFRKMCGVKKIASLNNKDVYPEDLKSYLKLSKWIKEQQGEEDTFSFLESRGKDGICHGLSLLEGISSYGSPELRKLMVHVVLCLILLPRLVPKAVDCGLDHCRGAVSLLREIDKIGFDDALNDYVAKQVFDDLAMAIRNVAVMISLRIPIKASIVRRLLASSPVSQEIQHLVRSIVASDSSLESDFIVQAALKNFETVKATEVTQRNSPKEQQQK